MALLLVKSRFAVLVFYNRPFAVVSKNRYCSLSYLGVRSNFISVTVMFFSFIFSYLLCEFVFSVIYLANKSFKKKYIYI